VYVFILQILQIHWIIIQDPVGEAGRLAAFLGERTDPDFLRAVCDACSFSKLRTSYESDKHVMRYKRGNHGDTPLKYAFRKGNNTFSLSEL